MTLSCSSVIVIGSNKRYRTNWSGKHLQGFSIRNFNAELGGLKGIDDSGWIQDADISKLSRLPNFANQSHKSNVWASILHSISLLITGRQSQ